MRDRVEAEDLTLATWRQDDRRDHKAGGDVVRQLVARTGAASEEYPLWMWH